MNERTLTVSELRRYGRSDELFRRLSEQELFTVDDMERMHDIGFKEGRASEAVASDMIDLLDGEVWREAVNEDIRDWMKSDLECLLYGCGEDDMSKPDEDELLERVYPQLW